MHMETLPHSLAAIAMTKAMHAVENQLSQARSIKNSDAEHRRVLFFKLLDRNAPALFSAVAAAAQEGKRSVHVEQIPGFLEVVNHIFKVGGGFFDSPLANQWLRDRDLSHVFHVSNMKLEW